MSTLYVLFLLLVIAYLGGFLMGGRGLRGVGLPSGSEWVVLGFLLGPSALGTVSGEDLSSFAPVASIAIGWIALLVGLTFGVNGGRRIPASRLVLGAVAGGLCAGAVAAAVWGTLTWVPAAAASLPSSRDRLIVALGTGSALGETARPALRWAVERLGAQGPLTDLLGDLAWTDELFPLLAVGAIVGLDTSLGIRSLPGGSLALGALLGLLTALLLGRRLRTTWFWALLFGTSLFATGVAQQLDVSVLSTLFALGLALALASPLRAEIRALPAWIEGPVVLPALFIAGARAWAGGTAAVWVVGAALLARLVSKGLTALVVAAAYPVARRAGPPLGLALDAAGPLSIAIGLSFQLRFPGVVGDTVLAAAAAAAVAGEFIGPPALRLSLRRAGELPDVAPARSDTAAAGTAAGGEAGR